MQWLTRWAHRNLPRCFAPRNRKRYTKQRGSLLWTTGTTPQHRVPHNIKWTSFAPPGWTNFAPPLTIGFIDFEFCTVDPPILDLAAVALTALLRSELAEWRSIVEGVLDAYLRSSSETFTLEDLHVAMHVRKLDSYFYHRDEALGRHSSNSVFERQEDQLRQLANAIQL